MQTMCLWDDVCKVVAHVTEHLVVNKHGHAALLPGLSLNINNRGTGKKTTRRKTLQDNNRAPHHNERNKKTYLAGTSFLCFCLDFLPVGVYAPDLLADDLVRNVPANRHLS